MQIADHGNPSRRVVPYESVGELRFGDSIERCLELFGQPSRARTRPNGTVEHWYRDLIVRFDSQNLLAKEFTLLPGCRANIDELEVSWDRAFLRSACKFEDNPRIFCGFVILPRLGIMVTGIHDDDPSQMAITAFQRANCADILLESEPFVWE